MEQETGEPDAQYFISFKKDDKLVRDYIKKMMGRIVFLYFLQSKGWLAGNLHYMHDLFYDASEEVKGDSWIRCLNRCSLACSIPGQRTGVVRPWLME